MTQHLRVNLELKSLSSREFEGHGSIFGNVDLGGDVVTPGAFRKSLAAHKRAGTMPQMFWMHKPDAVPGVWTAVAEDDKGLHVKGELVDTALGNEMHTLLMKKAVRGLSIGYQTVDSEFTKDGVRLLKEIDLWEVSLVSLAMNPLAKIEAVKARLSQDGEYVPTEREFENILRDAGCSRRVAARLVSKMFDGERGDGMSLRSPQWDAEDIDETQAKQITDALDALATKIVGAAFEKY